MTEVVFYERLRKQTGQNLPFVVYRKPESRQVKAFLQNSAEVFTTEEFSESGFVFAPFDTAQPKFLMPETASEKIIFEQRPTEGSAGKATSQKLKFSEEKRSAHIKLVENAVDKMKLGELKKVVLSRKEEVPMEEVDALELFQELLNLYPTAFVYCWSHPKTGTWLAATPETLLKVEGRKFSTMALAGTQKFSDSTDVEWGEKEKQEQQYVTDSIVENLNSCGLDNLNVSAPYTAKAGNLLHLRTDINGKIPNSEFQIPKDDLGTAAINRGSEADLKKIISALHPTPAVCGLPKDKAKDFILSEENYNREFYTGFLGELNLQVNQQRSRTRRNVENLAYRAVKKQTDLYVNLRCMKIEEGKAVLFVGGGITKDSNPEAEWEETVNKAQTMGKVLLKS